MLITHPETPLYHEILSLIERTVGEPARPFTCGKFDGVGWLDFHYVCSTYDGAYPRLALKQQKNAVHVYLMLWIDGIPVLERYMSLFGKSAVGKGCLRLKKLDPAKEAALVEIVQLAMAQERL